MDKYVYYDYIPKHKTKYYGATSTFDDKAIEDLKKALMDTNLKSSFAAYTYPEKEKKVFIPGVNCLFS